MDGSIVHTAKIAFHVPKSNQCYSLGSFTVFIEQNYVLVKFCFTVLFSNNTYGERLRKNFKPF